jgi:hypothetical protein
MAGKTITTFLINGNPKGIKTVFISNKVCQAVFIPRAKLAEVLGRQELQQPSLYFLLSGSDEKIYIGETENFLNRVKSHDNNKDFWDTALVFVSKDNSLTKADIKYLECLSLNLTLETAKYNLEENKNSPQAPNLPEHQKASVEEFFEDLRFLTSFLGYPIFDKIEQKGQEFFFCQTKETKAKGIYSDSGFTVWQGSKITAETTNTYLNPERREQLLKSSAKFENGYYILEKALTFNSPSAASSFCAGRRDNGWITWKNSEGKTLDEVFRNKLDQPTASDR